MHKVYIDLKHNRRDSIQKESNFGGRISSIKAAILNFYSSERLGREKKLYQEGGRMSERRRGEGVGQ